MNITTRLILIRGLPGSGKSSLAHIIKFSRSFGSCEDWTETVAADDFRVDEEGNYHYVPGEAANKAAHDKCIAEARRLVEAECNAIVHNTFIEMWELEPYREIAREFHSCQLQVITVHDPLVSNEELFERCEHGVPLSDIADMRRRFQFDDSKN